MIFKTANRRLEVLSLGFGLLLVPLQAACAGDQETAQTQGSVTDTVPEATLQSETPDQGMQRSTSPRISQEDQAVQPIQISQIGYNSGSGDAPVKVIEISDFGCGYCRRFHEETFPAILRSYVEAGFVEWKFVPFVLGMFPNGLQAATAAECAGEQDRFVSMQARLFADQSGWRNSDDPYAFFSNLATDEGLDVARFDSCVQGGWRTSQVRANIRLGQQAGVRGTPFFLVDGRPIEGALPLDDFRSVLDGALIQRGVTPPVR